MYILDIEMDMLVEALAARIVKASLCRSLRYSHKLSEATGSKHFIGIQTIADKNLRTNNSRQVYVVKYLYPD